MTEEEVFWYCVVGGIFCCALLGLIIGKAKNRAAFGFAMGILVGPLGLLIVALMPAEQLPGRACPFCLGVVPLEACKCSHCGSDLPARIPSLRDP